eukprot:2020085-Prymnesium_polylepis.1
MGLCCRRPSSDQGTVGSPAELYRPSRLLMRLSGGLLYVPKDLSCKYLSRSGSARDPCFAH